MEGTLKRKAPEAIEKSTPKKAASITSFFTPQGSMKSTSASFNKKAWADNLPPETRELLQLEIDTMHETWLGALKEELVSKKFLNLKRFLMKETSTVYPPPKDVYSWSRCTPLNTVKVVILGQDPYHGPNQAMGLSFSVRPPTPAPPSLKNIYKGIQNDYPHFKPPSNNYGDLTPWAKRGVLLLNTCLTVRAGNAGSHAKKGWELITGKVIELIAKKRITGVVFMAWGAPAQERCTKIDKKRHLVLASAHPSPLSAHRGFFDCGHFKKANDWLQSRYGDSGPIDWSLHGSPVGIPQKNPSEKAPVLPTPSAQKSDQISPKQLNEDYFDDDEEAMLEAMREAESMMSSQPEKDEATSRINNDVAQRDASKEIATSAIPKEAPTAPDDDDANKDPVRNDSVDDTDPLP